MKQPIEFHRAFESAKQVYELIRRREEERNAYPEQNPINREQVFAAGGSLLNGIDVRTNLRFIYRWKLRSFVRRFKWVRDFPDTVSDAVLNDAIKAAREAVKNPSNKETVRIALVAFEKMQPGHA